MPLVGQYIFQANETKNLKKKNLRKKIIQKINIKKKVIDLFTAYFSSV